MIKKIDLDDPKTSLEHGQIIKRKKFLRRLYQDFYARMLAGVPKKVLGKMVELGSGGGFLKEIVPEVVTSDILDIPGIDKVFSAERMPFKNSTIRAFLGLNVLHHIKDPERALSEIQRCLKKGGVISIIEPSSTFWAKLIYKNLHHEEFDENAGWKSDKTGPLSESNIALPWIILVRDRGLFEKKFPKLKVMMIKPINPFLYILAGGLRSWQLMPIWLYGIFAQIDEALSFMGMFVYIKIVKK